jgi:hypothetical protein
MSAQNYIDLVPHVNLVDPTTQMTIHNAQAAMAGKMSGQLGLAAPMDAALKALSLRIDNQVFVMSFEQLMWSLFFAFAFAYVPLKFLKTNVKTLGPVDLH